MKLVWLGFGVGIGMASLSLALGSTDSVSPVTSTVTNDTAMYQKLSEIRVPKQKEPDFGPELDRLDRMGDMRNGPYAEKLPSLASNPKLRNAIKRVSQKAYRYSGGQAAGRADISQ